MLHKIKSESLKCDQMLAYEVVRNNLGATRRPREKRLRFGSVQLLCHHKMCILFKNLNLDSRYAHFCIQNSRFISLSYMCSFSGVYFGSTCSMCGFYSYSVGFHLNLCVAFFSHIFMLTRSHIHTIQIVLPTCEMLSARKKENLKILI